MTTNEWNNHRNTSLSRNRSQRATTYRKTYNNNKIFNNKQKSICSRGSILEEFFSSGRLPAANATKAKSVRVYS